MSISKNLDKRGLAVITGGASGFGFEVAQRLLQNGMSVAVLDVSDKELANAREKLVPIGVVSGANFFGVRCNVTSLSECQRAQKAVKVRFPGKKIAFLFNNAGIQGKAGGSILHGSTELWKPIMAVNVYGAINIIQAFVPSMLKDGPLPSGLKSHVVTTSSVVGLLNHNPGAYSVSKMAVTAVGEQFSIELENMGKKAAHVHPHTLHPTVAATNFLTNRDADGKQQADDGVKKMMSGKAASATDIVDGLFRGLDAGHYYIVVDGPTDIPTYAQISNRMKDQMMKVRPRQPEQLGALASFGWGQKELDERMKRIRQAGELGASKL